MVFGRGIDRDFQKAHVPAEILQQHPDALPSAAEPLLIVDTVSTEVVSVIGDDQKRFNWDPAKAIPVSEYYTTKIKRPLPKTTVKSAVDKWFEDENTNVRIEMEDRDDKDEILPFLDASDKFADACDNNSDVPDFKEYLRGLFTDLYDWTANLQHAMKEASIDIDADFDLNFTFKDPMEILKRISYGTVIDKFSKKEFVPNYWASVEIGYIERMIVYAVKLYAEYHNKLGNAAISQIEEIVKELKKDDQFDAEKMKKFLDNYCALYSAYSKMVKLYPDLLKFCSGFVNWPFENIEKNSEISNDYFDQRNKFRRFIERYKDIKEKLDKAAYIFDFYGPVLEQLKEMVHGGQEKVSDPETIMIIVRTAVADILAVDCKILTKTKFLKLAAALETKVIKHTDDLIEEDTAKAQSYAAYTINSEAVFNSKTFRKHLRKDEKDRAIERYPSEVLTVANYVHENAPIKALKDQSIEKYIFSRDYLRHLGEIHKKGALSIYQQIFINSDDKVKRFLIHPFNIQTIVEFGEYIPHFLKILEYTEFSNESDLIKNGRLHQSDLLKNLKQTPELLASIGIFSLQILNLLFPTFAEPYFEDSSRANCFIAFAKKYKNEPALIIHSLEAIRSINDYEGLRFLLNAQPADLEYFNTVREVIERYGFNVLKRVRYAGTRETHERLEYLGFEEGEDLTVGNNAFERIARVKMLFDEEINIPKDAEDAVHAHSRDPEDRRIFESLYDLYEKLGSLEFLKHFDFLDDFDYWDFIMKINHIHINLLDKLVRDNLLIPIAENLAQNNEASIEFLDELAHYSKLGEALKRIREWLESFAATESELFLEKHSKDLAFVFKENAEFLITMIQEKDLTSQQLDLISRITELCKVLVDESTVSERTIELIAERIYDRQFIIIEKVLEFFGNGYIPKAIERFVDTFEADECISAYDVEYKEFVDGQESLIEQKLETERLAKAKKDAEKDDSKKEKKQKPTLEGKRVIIFVGELIKNYEAFRQAAIENGAKDPSVVRSRKVVHNSPGDLRHYLSHYDVVIVSIQCQGHSTTDKLMSNVPEGVYCEKTDLGPSGLKRHFGNLDISEQN